jgi:hypothetical protein
MLLQGFSNDVRLTVQVRARSREAKLIVERDGIIMLHVVAPPERGAANKEVIRWFAKKLHIPTSQVRLVSGLRSRTKVILIHNVSEVDVSKVLGLDSVRLE